MDEGQPKKILVIEDEEVLVSLIASKLAIAGYSVETAADGALGLEKIKEFRPDLILLDIIMPKVNGYEVLERMRRDGCATPVIIISNSGQPVEIEKAEKLGAVDFLVKAEFSPEEVLGKVKAYLASGRSKRPAPPKAVEAETDQNARQLDIKVFLVEDDSFLCDICRRKLLAEGFSVYTAVDGKEAVENIPLARPDLVLLDIILPSMDGFQVLSAIRSNPDQAIARVPVVMLSNLGQEEDVKKAMDAGADDYMVKAQFTTDDIVGKIRQILKK